MGSNDRHSLRHRPPVLTSEDFDIDENGTLIYPNYIDHVKLIIIRQTGKILRAIKFIPSILKPILECSPIANGKEYWWWRAVSATYYMRPNQATLDYLKTFHTLPIHENQTCVAMHIRHGDKDVEMSLVPFMTFAQTLDMMYNASLIPKPAIGEKIVVFIGTEDPEVLTEAEWFYSTSDIYTVTYTNLFDRQAVSAKLSKKVSAVTRQVHHELEYISMLVNLEYAVKCDVLICTLASNTCRLIDELRATIGGKANQPLADLSVESCPKPPCIGGGITNYGWRL